MREFQAYINGKFVGAANGATSTVTNPATGEKVFTVPDCQEQDISAAISAAASAQKAWSRQTPMARTEHVRKLAATMTENVDELAGILSREQGKTLRQSRGEIGGAARLINYHLGWDRRIEGEVLPGDNNNKENILLLKEPVGVVACIIPWNFPIYVLIRKIVPALIAGCTVICKPSGDTPAATLALAKLIDQAGFPAGVVNVVSCAGRVFGRVLSESRQVNMITVTGSVDTGREIMKIAAGNICKTSLELGGKAPAIVMPDADLDLAADCVVGARLANAGQVCSCAERLYVHESIAEKFTDMVAERMGRATFGDGVANEGHTMGAMINKQEVKRVHEMVERAVADGGKLVLGGKMPDGPGAFYPPTLITNVRQDSEIVQEEVFGPVLPVLTFKTPEEALELANDCQYGLTSSLYTNDYNVIMLFMNNIEFGELFVNRQQDEAFHGYHAGWKMSGVGGDDGKHGFEEFFKTRIVYLDYATSLY